MIFYYKKDYFKEFLILTNLIKNKYNNYLNYVIILLIILLRSLRFYIIFKEILSKVSKNNI
jgi:hypothetical protein